MSQPFITFFTPTYKRPRALAACLASVEWQTAVADVEQIVLPDHVGLGIEGGLYGRIPLYSEACRGRYVHILADDDELCGPHAVTSVRECAKVHGDPPIILVGVQKGPLVLAQPAWPPIEQHIDLGSMVIRRDVWLAHANDWGKRYEGDYDFAAAVHRAGHAAVYCPVMFLRGGQLHGAPEVAA
jgi:hypothetical protein